MTVTRSEKLLAMLIRLVIETMPVSDQRKNFHYTGLSLVMSDDEED